MPARAAIEATPSPAKTVIVSPATGSDACVSSLAGSVGSDSDDDELFVDF